MTYCIRTNAENKDFQKLVGELDADLNIRDGEEHAFYAQFNTINRLNHVIVAYDNELAIGCGAIKTFSADSVEMKRMFVQPSRRGQGIASIVLKELEQWAVELNYSRCVLETGKKQPEAIALYQKNGYSVIPNFGQYENVENSMCFEKILTH